MDKIRDNFTQWLKDNGMESLPAEKFVCLFRPCFLPIEFQSYEFREKLIHYLLFRENVLS